jgi:Na+/phosphate symporter
MMPVEVGAGVVIGANVGTTLTGILAAIGATSNAHAAGGGACAVQRGDRRGGRGGARPCCG